MKLVAMLRVKNQILTIKECLSTLSKLVDEIVIVDNGSTDGTLNVYQQFPKIVIVKKTSGFNEGRDKILAHKLAKSRKPDWILWIDGDEIFESNTKRRDFDKFMNTPGLNQVSFRMYNFWMSKKQYRLDGKWFLYSAYPQRSMWRNLAKTYFLNKVFHNGDIKGVTGKKIISLFRIKHFGYISIKQIQQRERIYNKLENLESSQKTLPTKNTNTITAPWLESSNQNINLIIQTIERTFWFLIRFFHKIVIFFAKPPRQKDN